jgi:retinol-binding protein 3
MRIGRFLIALLGAVPWWALAEPSTPIVPDTPAGHALAEWLSVFNGGERARFQSFEKAHAPGWALDEELAARARTGGYDLLSVDRADPLWIVFRVKDRANSVQSVGYLVVASSDPDHVSLLKITEESSGRLILDDVWRSRVIDAAADLLDEHYLFPDVGKTTAERLRTQHKRGAYRNIADGQILATRLTDDLREFSSDPHVEVDYSVRNSPPQKSAADPRSGLVRHLGSNCGFDKPEQFEPNIGYLKLGFFAEPEICGSAVRAAMTLLSDRDAIIFDLRDNAGGVPRMAALISSYLFDEPAHLDDLYDRNLKVIEQFWTQPDALGASKAAKRIFVLTSDRTFSAAEAFVYDLKSLGRATQVGESTAGGAHIVASHRIDPHFAIRVPFGQFINPITKTNWEGAGVQPDVKVPAEDALNEALKRARW